MTHKIEAGNNIKCFSYNPFMVQVPEGMAPPYRVNFEANEICNMPCGFCFADYHEGVGSHREKGLTSQGPLDTWEVKALAYQAASMGTTQFLFGGGDPFIRKDMPELIQYAHEQGLQVVVDTNGLILGSRQGLLDQVAPHIYQLGLSLDGPTAEAHDSFRGTHNSFVRVLKIIQQSAQFGYKLKINTIVTGQNAHTIPDMVAVLQPYAGNIARWSLDQFIPLNRGAQNKEKYEIDDPGYLAVVEEVKRLTTGWPDTCTIGGGLKSTKAGTVLLFGPQGIPYVTVDDQKHHLSADIRSHSLRQLIQMAEKEHLDVQAMNGKRYAQPYYTT